MNSARRGRLLELVLLIGAAWVAPALALAQATEVRAPAAGRQVLVAATEERLWLARVQAGNTVLSYRAPGSGFTYSEPFNAAVVSITAVGSQAYAFRDDGSFYRYTDDWTPALDLPKRQHVVHMVGVGGTAYALVASEVAARLPMTNLGEQEPTTRPFDPGEAPLSIVRYDGRGWSAVARCPVIVTAEGGPGLTPRLCHAQSQLLLLWVSLGPPQVHYAWFDLASRQWQLSSGTLGIPRMAAFWGAVVNRRATIVARAATRDGAETLRMYQLEAGRPLDASGAWQPAELDLSPLPDDAGPTSCLDAFGFNQHLGLLVTGFDGAAYLRFGRFDGPSAMATFDVDKRPAPEIPGATFRTLRFVIPVSILIALFAFRRSSIATPAKLPEGWALAFVLQRLAGCLIDIVPFSIAAAVALHVSWAEACRQMARWAFDLQMNETGLPSAPFLLWWFLSAGGYTVYSLVMELAVGRTIGKLLTRTGLLAEAGKRPAIWQILVRNVFRFVEVVPPFWILGFLIVLSRNRQRTGDIFAQTLAVRRATSRANDRRSAGSADQNKE